MSITAVYLEYPASSYDAVGRRVSALCRQNILYRVFLCLQIRNPAAAVHYPLQAGLHAPWFRTIKIIHNNAAYQSGRTGGTMIIHTLPDDSPSASSGAFIKGKRQIISV